MRYTKSGKPVCFAAFDRRSCQRVASYVYSYRSCGMSVGAWYCERCANLMGYQAFGQPLCRSSLEEYQQVLRRLSEG